MITFKDFRTAEALEAFQKENDVNPIKIETIIKEEWINQYFVMNQKYTQGYRNYNAVRLFYSINQQKENE